MDTTVRTKQGLIEGFREDGIFKFLGVPYAEPPVGERRWRLPIPMAEWAGVRKAQEFGPICPQTAGAVFQTRATRQSEDCLYLNVWTRSLDSQARQPVMIWIHGGGYLGGGGCEDGTDGSHLAAQGVPPNSPGCAARAKYGKFCGFHKPRKLKQRPKGCIAKNRAGVACKGVVLRDALCPTHWRQILGHDYARNGEGFRCSLCGETFDYWAVEGKGRDRTGSIKRVARCPMKTLPDAL